MHKQVFTISGATRGPKTGFFAIVGHVLGQAAKYVTA